MADKEWDEKVRRAANEIRANAEVMRRGNVYDESRDGEYFAWRAPLLADWRTDLDIEGR